MILVKKLYLISFSVIILSCYVNVLSAQHGKAVFDHLTVEDGLSQSGVLSITQDSLGFMWFGTRDGLNKYDTQKFEIFKNSSKDPNSISTGLNIYALYTDSKGRLWIGTSNGLNLYQPETNDFKRFLHNNNQKYSISNNVIHAICEDKSGAIWIATDHGLNKLIGPERFETHLLPSEKKEDNNIKAIFCDDLNNFWLGTNNSFIKMFYKGGQYHFKNYNSNKEYSTALRNDEISSITQDQHKNVWIGTRHSGIYCFNEQLDKFTNYTHQDGNPNTVLSNTIRKLLISKDGKLWITTIKGISIYDLTTNFFQHYDHDPDDYKSLNQNSCYDIYQDKAGSIWIGTFFGGANVLYATTTPFEIHQHQSFKNSISGNIISKIAEDKNHNLWIGTEGEGLNYYNPATNMYTHYANNVNSPFSLSSNLVKAISIEKSGRVWIGTTEGGLDYIEPNSERFIHYQPNPKKLDDLFSTNIFTLLHDSQGRFWVGTSKNGLFLYNDKEKSFTSLLKLDGDLRLTQTYIKNIFEDSHQNLWIACANGLSLLRKGQNVFETFQKGDTPMDLETENINTVQEDSKGQIWVGSYDQGLALYNSKTGKFKKFNQKDGLPSNNILGILEDRENNLWISTDNGLAKFDGEIFKIYTIKDGLQGNVFNINSFLKHSDGTFYFGGYNGFVSFVPKTILQNQYLSPIVFTALKIFNNPVKVNDGSSLLSKSIGLTREIDFSYNQNVFTIDFALLNFIKSKKNKYAYKLQGFDKDWNYADVPSASYSNLPSGNYTLSIRASNNDGVWVKDSSDLLIYINPPFWETWWAYLFYLCAISSLLFFIIRFFLIKELLKKEYEIHQLKLDFFTNVSHEIRTPLTLIVGPLENLLQYTQDNDFLNRQLLIVKSNANRLSRLVNELMDFRKAESGKMKLQISENNLINFTKEIYLSFKYLALEHEINYLFTSDSDDVTLYFDCEQLEKVFFNLLSNAFKFTPDRGEIEISIINRVKEVEVRVRDTGKGIAKEDVTKLFSDFYQVEEFNSKNIGTGIGLALSKKIAELHQANLILENSVVSPPQLSGSVFLLSIPKGKAHFNNKDIVFFQKGIEGLNDYALSGIPDNTEQQIHDQNKEGERFSILIVEDNPDVRSFIKQALHSAYSILEAENGVKGFELAVDQIPDLILSDVMMPEMDGLELCRKLKMDERTSHIPIILLTARSGNIHHVTGLKTGADIYITKPFSVPVLLLNINNMLSLGDKMRKKFSQQMTLQPTNVVVDFRDREFINKVLDVIETNLNNSDFGVHELAAIIGMSSPVFYKKIKFLTGLSVNNFIKTIRLKRASQLLQSGSYTVYQVCYEVGFSDRQYFSQEFRKQFGQSPSVYSTENK